RHESQPGRVEVRAARVGDEDVQTRGTGAVEERPNTRRATALVAQVAADDDVEAVEDAHARALAFRIPALGVVVGWIAAGGERSGREVGEEGCQRERLAFRGETRGRERPRVAVVRDDLPCAGERRRERDHAAAGPDVQDPSSTDPGGRVEEDPGEGQPAGPGEGPERRRHRPAGQPLRRLPDLQHAPRLEDTDLRDERGRTEIRVPVQERRERVRGRGRREVVYRASITGRSRRAGPRTRLHHDPTTRRRPFARSRTRGGSRDGPGSPARPAPPGSPTRPRSTSAAPGSRRRRAPGLPPHGSGPGRYAGPGSARRARSCRGRPAPVRNAPPPASAPRPPATPATRHDAAPRSPRAAPRAPGDPGPDAPDRAGPCSRRAAPPRATATRRTTARAPRPSHPGPTRVPASSRNRAPPASHARSSTGNMREPDRKASAQRDETP